MGSDPITAEEEMQYRDRECIPSERIGSQRIHGFICRRNDVELADAAYRIYQECIERGIDIVTIADEKFPKRFIGLDDTPSLIYIKGKIMINDHLRSVGVVGARRCSREGKEQAIHVTEEELSQGAAIISGMAKGIDSYAHTAAIKAGGYTVAVLGGGADICYPSEHRALYDRICEQGCILSEYPPGTTPKRYMFPRRNRIIAALSDSLYVVDAGRNSGTETTAAHAVRYGIEVNTINNEVDRDRIKNLFN